MGTTGTKGKKNSAKKKGKSKSDQNKDVVEVIATTTIGEQIEKKEETTVLNDPRNFEFSSGSLSSIEPFEVLEAKEQRRLQIIEKRQLHEERLICIDCALGKVATDPSNVRRLILENLKFYQYLQLYKNHNQILNNGWGDIYILIFCYFESLNDAISLASTCSDLYILSMKNTIWQYYVDHYNVGSVDFYWKKMKTGFCGDEVDFKWKFILCHYYCRFQGHYYRVLYSFESDVEDEMNVRMGDILLVFREQDDNQPYWWRARNETRNEEGWVPSNYLDLNHLYL